jgi:hypothetical protein
MQISRCKIHAAHAALSVSASEFRPNAALKTSVEHSKDRNQPISSACYLERRHLPNYFFTVCIFSNLPLPAG